MPTTIFLNQLSRQETPEDTVRGVVYRNEIGYPGTKAFQNNATIKTVDIGTSSSKVFGTH